MVAITGNPFKIADASFKIVADNYEAMISSAEIVPTASTSTFTGIGGRKYPFVGKSSYVLNITFAQDWSTANSLSLMLFNGEGLTKVITLVPKAGGPSFTATVVLVAPNIGGAAEADAVSTVTLMVIDKPVLVP